MAEQTQDKEAGSVAMPLVVGVAGGVGGKMIYSKASKQLVSDAIAGAEGVKAELSEAAKHVLASDQMLTQNNISANVLSEEGRIANLTGATIERLTGEDSKGFKVNLTHPEGTASTLTVSSLEGEASKLLKEGEKNIVLTSEQLTALKNGGEKSWVAKTTKKAQEDVIKAVRGNEAWGKAGGGVKATLSHMSGGTKLLAGAAAIATVGGLGYGIANMISNPSTHTSRVEADRNAPAQEPAR